MTPSALRAVEFDRIVSIVAGLAVTPLGAARLAELTPSVDAAAVLAAQRATTEATRFLATQPGFPLRAPSELPEILGALHVEGRPLEPLRLLGLAEYLESIEQSRAAVVNAAESLPILTRLVAAVVSFRGEIAGVRRRIEPSGDVADNASPALAAIRERLRRQRTKLRSTLDAFVRDRDTSKYLQQEVVTDRHGRYVLMVRAEHRHAIPGIVHGGSASGASLFVEPLETVEINNDIVALEEQEAEEVRRILLELTDAFRDRPDDLERTIEVATELDVVQARGRFSEMVGGVEPSLSTDGAFDLKQARHPLLMRRKWGRWSFSEDSPPAQERTGGLSSEKDHRPHFPEPVPVDIRLTPPARILVIAGPNTGGKTVALKTAGLFAAMAQAGLHIPADAGSTLPVFQTLFADIGDEQSIAASLSTFSGHIANIVAMDRELRLPALLLLDEVGAGTDPMEGGALGVAIIDHFRRRGAHLVATTHYDALKSYAATAEHVVSAAFGFNPDTFAPTYRLLYGSPGRSLAIEIAARLGLPAEVIAAARANLTEPEKQLADHLARVDEDLRRLELERRALDRDRLEMAQAQRKLDQRDAQMRDREEALRRRVNAKVDDQIRDARREIDLVVESLKTRAAELSQQAAVRLRTGETLRPAGISTGDTGAARADARAALDAIAERLRATGEPRPAPGEESTDGQASVAPAPGMRVAVGALGLEGVVVDIQGKHAEVDVRGKRLRAALRDLRVIGNGGATSTPERGAGAGADRRQRAAPAASVRVNVNLQPREGLLSELNVIGNTADDAIARLEKFLDDITSTDLREIRIVHGFGTGKLRAAITEYLKGHPLVERFEAAPQNQGGGGATIVLLRE